MDFASLMSNKKLILQIAMVLLAVTLICFFLPFISFSGEKISGFDVVTELFTEDTFDGEGTMMSIWGILAFLAAVAGIVFSLGVLKLNMKLTASQLTGICAAVSAVALLLSHIAFNSMVDDALGEYASFISLSMNAAGWWIAFIAAIIAAAGSFYAGYLDKKQQQPPITY